jgi:hypothetical protein
MYVVYVCMYECMYVCNVLCNVRMYECNVCTYANVCMYEMYVCVCMYVHMYVSINRDVCVRTCIYSFVH